MALDTFNRVANQVRMRIPSADILLAQDAVNHAFRQIAERRHWSWLIKFGQFISPPLTNAGTVTATNGSAIVVGSGTAWTSALIGLQFRIGIASPIYTVKSVESATQLTLDAPFGYQTSANVGYQIYQAYFTPPSDFLTFMTIWDPRLNWQLHLNATQDEINMYDAQRAYVGLTYAFVQLDYTTNYAGSVAQPVQIVGTGAIPATTGAYTGASNTVYTIQITGNGGSGTATFQWKVGSGAFSGNILTSTNPTTLNLGVQVYFPAIGTYASGDTFIIQALAIPQVGLPRFEGWPHYQGAYNWPFLYISRATDLEDPGAVLPRTIRGDVLLEMALAELAGWPGNPPDKPNPYYNLSAKDRHERKAERMIAELEVVDDNIYETDLKYSAYIGMPFAPAPWLDATYIQSHDIGLVGLY